MKNIILTIALFALIPGFLMADPPKKVIATYSKENNKLKIVAEHPVKDVADHYIDQITISVDGKEVKVIKPKKQSSLQSETDEVNIPEIKQGSKVEVKARCNEFGSKKTEITIL
jgi:hypothetical protein